jgi:hypothetical protein
MPISKNPASAHSLNGAQDFLFNRKIYIIKKPSVSGGVFILLSQRKFYLLNY